jgi:tetratricopeptide (TPR) repeat protein
MINLLKRNYTLYSLSLIITILLSCSCHYSESKRIFKENNNAVVVVFVFDNEGNPIGHGNGFIVRKDGAIVTNYHVISNAEDIKVKAGENILPIEGILHTDKENDLVILKAKANDLPIAKIGDAYKENTGSKVYLISSHKGLENTISDGILSRIIEIKPKGKLLQITTPISAGSSGSPIFNKKGEVIGIATFFMEDEQNISFAMPVNLIKDNISSKKVIALKEAGIEYYEKTAVDWFYIGMHYAESGMHRMSIEAFKQAIRLKPDLAEAHYNLGIVYGKGLGKYKEAIEAFKQAIRIKPNHAEAHLNLGQIYFALEMHKEALEAYKQAIRIKPDYVIAHSSLGLMYLLNNDRESALEQYELLKELDPKKADELLNLINSFSTHQTK